MTYDAWLQSHGGEVDDEEPLDDLYTDYDYVVDGLLERGINVVRDEGDLGIGAIGVDRGARHNLHRASLSVERAGRGGTA